MIRSVETNRAPCCLSPEISLSLWRRERTIMHEAAAVGILLGLQFIFLYHA